MQFGPRVPHRWNEKAVLNVGWNWRASRGARQYETPAIGANTMDTTTILIIVVLILLLGGGWYGRGRWYGR